jgi:hypothetical protein
MTECGTACGAQRAMREGKRQKAKVADTSSQLKSRWHYGNSNSFLPFDFCLLPFAFPPQVGRSF